MMRTVCSLVVGCLLGYSSWLVVWNPLLLDPSNGVFRRFDLAALLRLPHPKFLFVCLIPYLKGACQQAPIAAALLLLLLLSYQRTSRQVYELHITLHG